jgi:hypothetical protein
MQDVLMIEITYGVKNRARRGTMPDKEVKQTEKETTEKGFWASLGIEGYLELIIWIVVIVSGIYSLIQYFN